MTDDVTLPGTGEKVETQQQPDGSHRQVIALGAAESAALIAALKAIANPISLDQATGSMRATVAGNLTTVSGVTTVTNLAQLGAVPANTIPDDMMRTAWATTVRGRII